ncbi:MAG TPA: hypothetical protein VJP80_01770 [Candidatus Saccharimonadales bacterium]|nr:hypothetical protein [Candidatus Saccharimonadales bacterium]
MYRGEFSTASETSDGYFAQRPEVAAATELLQAYDYWCMYGDCPPDMDGEYDIRRTDPMPRGTGLIDAARYHYMPDGSQPEF